MGLRRGIDRKKVGCRSLIDANLEGQVGVNKFKLYHMYILFLRKKQLCVVLNILTGTSKCTQHQSHINNLKYSRKSVNRFTDYCYALLSLDNSLKSY